MNLSTMSQTLKRKSILPLAVAGCMAAGTAYAATTDLASTPVVTSSSSTVKPNLMFILDDSGSMDLKYMPDSVDSSKHCYRNHLYNRVYYNYDSAFTYPLPIDASGASYPNASFTGAKDNGFNSGSTTTNLNTDFKAHDSDSGGQAYYYKYTGTSPATPVAGTCYPDTSYTKVSIGPSSSEAQKFANWYSYYSTRMLMMKSAVGLAFKTVDSAYRLGFMTINTSSTSTGANFLDIGDFTSDGTASCSSATSANRKQCWYKKLYDATPSGSTPLRAALSKAGRIYAGKVGTDPVQYSCQQNFSILSTDGYWNSSAGYQVDGTTAIGNQDNNATLTPRPLYDGGIGSATNTLADVASYYYRTDLRPAGSTGALGSDVSTDNVRTAGDDTATWQHMTTFTLGLGVDGRMVYSPTYESDTSGDFYNVKNGTKNKGTSPCSWAGAGGTCNWPIPSSGAVENIDDLWHAAVNGHGLYISAATPDAVREGLNRTLARLAATLGAAAAATTSNPNISAGDNYVFSSSFITEDWTGELKRQKVDLATGNLSTVIDWVVSDCKAPVGYTLDTSACANLLDNVVYSSRKIYTYDPTNTFGANQLRLFQWGNLTAVEQGYFSGGADMVNFLRGDRSKEGSSFRIRKHVLGDIISSEAIYVKKPVFRYADAYYSTYQSDKASRQAALYVGANDGMLHAFNADTGAELWAYIPSHVLPQLNKLAGTTYTHQFYVDGSPVAGDVCNTTYDAAASAYVCPSADAWKTLLVGGLGGGGRGLYALDVTDPANPVALWEFTHDTTKGTGYTTNANLGYSYGNPVITKRPDGRWVVLVASGYNNVSPGDGEGRLFVLDALTGTILDQKSTGTGTVATPSGFARISGWGDNPSYNNTVKQVYGGDLLGNLWRFDLTGGSLSVLKLAELTDPSGAAQPITARPALGNVGGTHVVYVGTGKLLGTTDLTNTQVQSFYAIKDGGGSLGAIRSSTSASKYTISTVTDPTTGSQHRQIACGGGCTWADFASGSTGWYFDLPDSGERANTDPALALGTLAFISNTPKADACYAGGEGWLYYLDYATGKPVATATGGYVGKKMGNTFFSRGVVTKLGSDVRVWAQGSDGSGPTGTPLATDSSSSAKRIYWREIFSQ